MATKRKRRPKINIGSEELEAEIYHDKVYVSDNNISVIAELEPFNPNTDAKEEVSGTITFKKNIPLDIFMHQTSDPKKLFVGFFGSEELDTLIKTLKIATVCLEKVRDQRSEEVAKYVEDN